MPHEVPNDDGAYGPMLTPARPYDEDNLSQQIADRLSASHSTLSRSCARRRHGR